MSDVVLVAFIGGVAVVLSAVIQGVLGRPTRRKIDKIDKAVNDQETGMPTLVSRVVDQDRLALRVATDLIAYRDWMVESVTALASERDIALPPIPPTVPVNDVVLPERLANPDAG